MGMPAATTSWTVEMLDALEDDGQRYELIDGELFVTPTPAEIHQLVLAQFLLRLNEYLRRGSVGRVIHSPADVRRADRSRNRVQPDVFVVRLTDGKRPQYPYDLGDLLLAVEVESPSNPALDYQVKRRLYLQSGIPEYWVVNPVGRVLSRFRGVNDPGEVFTERIEWHPDGMDTALTIDLPALFDEAVS